MNSPWPESAGGPGGSGGSPGGRGGNPEGSGGNPGGSGGSPPDKVEPTKQGLVSLHDKRIFTANSGESFREEALQA
jgi:hypothetical protein